MSQSAVLEQEDMQNEQDSIQPDPLLTSPNHTNINQLPLLQYRNGFFQGHIDEYSQRQGKGVYYWSSGEIYYGDWNQDRMEGEGIFYFAFGGYAYGTFLEDKVHGYAVLCFSNGDYIAGFWERGVLTGKVIQYSKGPDDWCLYDYKDGSPEKVAANGKGKPPISTFSMIESAHLQKLVDRELDIFSGENEGNLGFLPIGEQGWYHGFSSSENGNPHGLGVICHLENKIDRGLFKEGNLDGPGRSIFENGDVYDGFFKGGKFNGAGVYFKSQTEQYLYGVYENSECVQALTLGNGYPHELISKIFWEIKCPNSFTIGTLKGDFKLEESEYIDKDTDFEVLILSELSRAQSMADGVDQREWMSISRNAHEESRDQSLPLESQRSKQNGSRSALEKEPEKQQQVGSNKNVSSIKSVKSVKSVKEEKAVSHASNGSNASVKSQKQLEAVNSRGKVSSQPQSQNQRASAHNSRASVQSKGGKQVDSKTSVHEEVVVQQKSGYSSIESNKKSGPGSKIEKNPSSDRKSQQQQAVSREVSERGGGGSVHHVSNKSQREAVNSEPNNNKKSTPVVSVSGGGNKSSDRNASIGDFQKHDSNILDANFVNINNKKGGLIESSPEIKRKFTEESPSRHTKSEVLEIHSARSGHSDRLNRKTHETINNEVTNIMDQIFRSGTEPRDSHNVRENLTEQSQGAIYYDLNGSFGSPLKTQQSQREHVKRAHLPDRDYDHDNSRKSGHSSRGDLADTGSEIKAKTSINDRKVEHSKQESYEEEHKDYVDQGPGNQALEQFIKNLGREVKSEILDGQLSNRLSLRKKTTEGYSEANHHQVVIEEEIYRIMMSKIELLLREQTRTTERLDEIKRIIDTKLDPLLKNHSQGNQALKKELSEKVGTLAREKDYDSNVDILRKMHQDLVQHTRMNNISLNITHTKLDTLLVAHDIPSPYIGHPDCVLDPPLTHELLSGQIFKSQYDKSMIEAGSAATTLEQPNSAAFFNRTQIIKEQPQPKSSPAFKAHQPAFDDNLADYMSITSDSAPLKTVNAFTPHAKQLAAKNEHIFNEFTPYQSKDSALSQSIVKFRNSMRPPTEHNNSSGPENQLSSNNYVLTQTPRDKITYLHTEESVQQPSEPTLRSLKSSSKNDAPATSQRSGRINMSEISPEPNVSPDRRDHQGSSTPRPKESTGSNVKDKSRWNLGFCGQSEDIEEPEAFLGPKKFMKTSNVQHQTEDSRILQTQGQETNRSHSSQTQTQTQLRAPQQNTSTMKKSSASYKPSSLKLIENLHGSRIEGDNQQSHRSQVSHRSQRSQRESARRNDTGPISDMSVFDHFVVTSNNNRIPSPSAGEYIRIEKGGASQRSMAFMRGQNQEAHRGTQSASAKKNPVENNLRVREVNIYEEEGSQIYDDRMNTQQNTLPDENTLWRNSVGGRSYIQTATGVSPIKIRREPLSAQHPLKNSVHEGRLGSVRWRLELEVDEEFDRSPISQRNIVEEILGVDPVEDDVNTLHVQQQHHLKASHQGQSIKSSKLVSTTVAGGLTSERNWERQQYVPQEQIHQDIYYVNEGDDPLSSRRSYKMSERNYPETKVVYPAQALENMAVMRTHPDDYIEKVVNREVSTRKSGNSQKSSYNVIEDEDYANHSNRLENVQIKAWDQGLIDNLNNRGQGQNIKVYKNQYQHM